MRQWFNWASIERLSTFARSLPWLLTHQGQKAKARVKVQSAL